MWKCTKRWKKDQLDVAVDGPLEGVIEGAPESTPQGAPTDAISELHKDAQEGAFQVALALHLWLHLLLHSLMHKSAQNNTSNCGFDGFDCGLKVGLSSSKKKLFYLIQWKPFKNDEKCFLFHPKSSFRSQDIEIFV